MNKELKLANARIGGKYIVVRVDGPALVKRRLLDMGIISGTKLEVVGVAPLGDPLHIKARGYDLTLRLDEASNIVVREISE